MKKNKGVRPQEQRSPLVPASHSLAETYLKPEDRASGLWCWKLSPNDFNSGLEAADETKAHARQTRSAVGGERNLGCGDFDHQCEQPAFYCIWECYNVSHQYWLHIFFIVCIHRHGMMELQLMSRNEFLLCLIKTKQNKTFLLLAAPTLGAGGGPAVPSAPGVGWETVWTALGPRIPVDYKSHSQGKKSKTNSQTHPKCQQGNH